MAAVYDAFTSAYDYERWLGVIEELALRHGTGGHDLFDVACGTGKSFMPMLARGYRVTACDMSPEMLELARRKSGRLAELHIADMRCLPDLGRYDLVTCLDDSLNHLLSDEELAAALGSIARLLRPKGVFIFDVNTLRRYRSMFVQTYASEQTGVFFCWCGDTEPDLAPGGRASGTLEAFVAGETGWQRRSIRVIQRHHPAALIARLCRTAGLEVVEVCGMLPGVQIEPAPDEMRHMKALYVTRRTPDSC